MRNRSGTANKRAWWFLDTLVIEHATVAGGPIVLEQTLPLGAAPPRHIHRDLDDSWYLLDGQMVVQYGDETRLVSAGHWVSVPRGTVHTFRVMGDRPARTLLVHNNDSFLGLVRDLGDSTDVEKAGLPPATGGPGFEALSRAVMEHDSVVVGDSLSHQDAMGFIAGLGPDLTLPSGGGRR